MDSGFPIESEKAFGYVGQTVLVELIFDEEPEPYWMCLHVVGVVLPKEGVYEHAFFMVIDPTSKIRSPYEVYFSHIRTIRAMRHRDRHGSGNVLDRMTLPNSFRSGAALPAHRDGGFVAMNGSTGAAHP